VQLEEITLVKYVYYRKTKPSATSLEGATLQIRYTGPLGVYLCMHQQHQICRCRAGSAKMLNTKTKHFIHT
jgi:hypothetical protein